MFISHHNFIIVILGTLMSDILRVRYYEMMNYHKMYCVKTAQESFPEFYNALNVHLVEASPALRKIQAKTLQCDVEGSINTNQVYISKKTSGSKWMKIQWHSQFDDVPKSDILLT
jgi:hypothetical protein